MSKRWRYRDLIWNTSGVLPLTRIYPVDCLLAGLGWIVSMMLVIIGIVSGISLVLTIAGGVIWCFSSNQMVGYRRDLPYMLWGSAPVLVYGVIWWWKEWSEDMWNDYKEKLNDLD